MGRPFRRVIVVGLDGLEPKIAEAMLRRGELPHLGRVAEQGRYARIHTTYSAQTPVAWSTFATGTNPGGHGIYDFVHRDPRTYLPTLSLNRYFQKNVFTLPKAVNMRRGQAVWQVVSAAGLSSTILRCPCTFPPDEIRGNMLAGVGVPDLRGGLGTSAFYTSDPEAAAGESENLVRVEAGPDAVVRSHLIGPRNPRDRSDYRFDVTFRLEPVAGKITVISDGQPRSLEVREGRWSDWLRVKFKTGPLSSVKGMVRFHLTSIGPVFRLHASPVNFDPDAPLFPISSPPEYAGRLAASMGPYYTTGMVEDHGGLNNERFDESAYLDQCAIALRERDAMMVHELNRFGEGLFYCLFDTPDRLQHMFWRYREPEHPANRGAAIGEWSGAIEQHYRACDAIVGEVLRYTDDQTLLMVLSDHGMNSFQRGFHLNTWLHDNEFLALKGAVKPGDEEAGDFFRAVDWDRTQAYALGLGSVYLNRRGREANGILTEEQAASLKAEIVARLTGLQDPERRCTAIRGVSLREDIYSGPYAGESPDLLVNFAEGYRVSWATPLGGMAAGWFEDNRKKWSADHAIDPVLVPGVLFMNRAFQSRQPDLRDMAPTILAALGLPKGAAMEGEALVGATLPASLAKPAPSNAGEDAVGEGDREETAPEEPSLPDEEAVLRERLRGLGYVE